MSIGPKLSAEIDHDATDLSESESLVTSPETLFTQSEISEYDVFLLLSNLKSLKSTGIDSIPARGSGGMLPRKILKSRTSETAFPAILRVEGCH